MLNFQKSIKLLFMIFSGHSDLYKILSIFCGLQKLMTFSKFELDVENTVRDKLLMLFNTELTFHSSPEFGMK